MAASQPAQQPAPEQAADTTANIHIRLLNVAAGIGALAKSGHNDFHNYDFVPFGAIREAVKAGLVEHRVAMHTMTTSTAYEVVSGQDGDGRGKRSIIATASGEILFVNVDDPSEVVAVPWSGLAIDSSDKALSKAITSGLKAALLGEFAISTEDDPDRAAPDLPGGNQGGGYRQQQGRGGYQQRGGYGNDANPFPPDYDPSQGGGEQHPMANGGDHGQGPVNDPGMCPVHRKAWRSGQRGYYCATKVGDGWCEQHPSAEWAARAQR